MPVIRHDAPVENANGHALVRRQQHLFKSDEILVFLEQPQSPVGTVQDMLDQPARSLSRDSWHSAGSLIDEGQLVKARVTLSFSLIGKRKKSAISHD